MPTIIPTAQPTRSCVPGEYRTVLGPCKACAVGTYWNETYETTQCLNCPADQTSLEGATQCYTPCSAGQALDTGTLTCVAIPSKSPALT